MNTIYDDESIDALIAASLRPLKDEPTDDQIEAVYEQAVELSPKDEAVIASARARLVAALSGKRVLGDTTSSVRESEISYAAMNRENADDEFDDATRDAIEDARRKALDDLDNSPDDELDGHEDDAREND